MDTKSAAQAMKDAFADAIGEDRSKVGMVDPQWRELLKACCVVKIHVTRWRAETTLTLADLGIEPKDDAERRALTSVLSLGTRYLLPRTVVEYGQHLENRFRNALWRRTLPSHFGNLLPDKLFVAWKTEATQIQKAYMAWAQDVYEHWDEYQAQVRLDYYQIGLQAWNRLEQSGRQMPPMVEWVSAFVERCMAKSETRDYWLAKARMWWDDPTFIPLTPESSDEVLEQAYALAKSEMERDIYAGAKKHFEEGLFQFMADVRGEITERIFNVLVDVLAAMDKDGGNLPRNSSKQLKNLLDGVEELKFWDDAKLDEQIAAIRSILNQRAIERNYTELEGVMRQVGAEARQLLFELGRPIQKRSRHVGIPETEQTLGVALRQTRQALVLDDELPLEAPRRQQRRLEIEAA